MAPRITVNLHIWHVQSISIQMEIRLVMNAPSGANVSLVDGGWLYALTSRKVTSDSSTISKKYRKLFLESFHPQRWISSGVYRRYSWAYEIARSMFFAKHRIVLRSNKIPNGEALVVLWYCVWKQSDNLSVGNINGSEGDKTACASDPIQAFVLV